MNEIDCTLSDATPLPTANDCRTRGAARRLAFPGWSALIKQVPTPMGETTEPTTVQTPALLGSALKTTGRPELAVAATM